MPDEDEAQRRDLVAGERQVDEAHPLEQGPEDDRPDHHAAEARQAAEDQDRVAEEGVERLERVLAHRLEVDRQEPARQRAQRRPRSPATAACRRRRSCPARGRRPRPRGSPAAPAPRASGSAARARRRARPSVIQTTRNRGNALKSVPPSPIGSRMLADDPVGDVVPRVGEEDPRVRVELDRDRALVAARDVAGVLGDVADDLREGDRRDREVVGAQAQRRAAR